MKKINELQNKNSCFNKADDDETMFVLLSRDPAAADTVRFWVQKRIESGRNKASDIKILEALACAEQMEKEFIDLETWQ